MRVSTMVRAGALTAIAALAVACTDSPNAPRQAARTFVVHPYLDGGNGSNGHGRQNQDSLQHSTSFTVDPSVAQTFKFGSHSVYFPAHSICDPATSGYDPSLWDAPCAPVATPITITASWTDKHGHAYVDFQPALRFVPTSDPSQYVTLTLKDTPTLLSGINYVILWQRPTDGAWVQESATDATEQESVDLGGNKVSRRIKHFSGYNVFTGMVDNCDPLVNPDWCLNTTFIQ